MVRRGGWQGLRLMVTMAEILGASGPGRVLTVFCDDVPLSRQHMQLAGEEQEPAPTVVGLEWEEAPALTHEIEEIRDALADAARLLWPSWYTTVAQRFDRASAKAQSGDVLLPEVSKLPSGVSMSWLESAWQRCRAKATPMVEGMVTSTQVRQLALALDPSRLVCVLSVASEVASSPRVQALARAAEWLALQTKAKVIVLVPRSWQENTALDHVTYGAIFYDAAAFEAPGSLEVAPLEAASVENATTQETSGSTGSPKDASRRAERSSAGTSPVKVGNASHHNEASETAMPQVSVGPICGRPHPKSHVENLMFALLQADKALSGRFECNQPLVGIDKKPHVVDLLWRKGKLVVELDGPEHHCQSMYIRDRQRDYSLMMKGYTVLRITNAEVNVQQDQALEKIKNLVQLISRQNEKRVKREK